MKIPAGAFEAYAALGPGRSHEKLAEMFGASKRAVTRRAVKERWAERLAEVEAKAAEEVGRRLLDDEVGMRLEHISAARALMKKAMAALEAMPIESAGDAVKMVLAAVKVERLAREATQHRVALQIEKAAHLDLDDDDGPRFWQGAHHARARLHENGLDE
jgi:hypothetical protein